MFDGVRTLFQVIRGEEFGDTTPTTHVVLSDDEHRGLRRYGTAAQVDAARAAGTSPVLLVPPLAVDASCYDLAPGQSVVGEILAMGRIPYVVDYGDMGRADRHLGFEAFFDDIVPQAIERVLADHRIDDDGVGDAGPGVDLVAWSLGGTVSFLTVGAHPELPVRSITAIGTPLNYDEVTPYPLVKRVMRPTGGRPVLLALKAMGGISAPLVRLAYRATAFEREIKKPGYIMRNADDRDALARMQVIDRFQDSMPGYPGRLSEQMWTNLVYRDEIAGGVLDFDGRIVDIRTVKLPVALFGSHRDAIVSWAAAQHGVDLFTDSPRVDFTTVNTSHLGLIVGKDAVEHTWPTVAGFLAGLDR